MKTKTTTRAKSASTIRKIIGDFSNEEKVLVGLNIGKVKEEA